MPNNQSNILPVVFAQALKTLREYCVMPRLVNNDLDNVPVGLGDTVNVRVPVAVPVSDVTPSAAAQAAQDNSYERRSLTLNKHRRAGFYLTDKERGEIGQGIVPMEMQEAVKALANDINAFILLQCKDFFTAVGTPGTSTFNGTTWQAATSTLRAALQAMSTNVVPPGDRRLVLNPVSYAAALGVEGFVLAQNRASNDAIQSRAIGRLLGLDWFEDQAVPGHSSTALTAGATTINGVNNAGSYTVSISKATNSSPLVRGDIITFGGRSYSVAADVTLAVGSTTVTLTSPLRATTAGGEAVTLLASHSIMNVAFHRDAVHFASRPLTSEVASDKMISMADPVSGVALRLEVVRQNKQDFYDLDVLYGAKSFRPELGVRVVE